MGDCFLKLFRKELIYFVKSISKEKVIIEIFSQVFQHWLFHCTAIFHCCKTLMNPNEPLKITFSLRQESPGVLYEWMSFDIVNNNHFNWSMKRKVCQTLNWHPDTNITGYPHQCYQLCILVSHHQFDEISQILKIAN